MCIEITSLVRHPSNKNRPRCINFYLRKKEAMKHLWLLLALLAGLVAAIGYAVWR